MNQNYEIPILLPIVPTPRKQTKLQYKNPTPRPQSRKLTHDKHYKALTTTKLNLSAKIDNR